MLGLSRHQGLPLGGPALFVELAEDALTTALGSREKRRDYGSRLPQLLGQPQSAQQLLQAQIYAAETFSNPANRLAALFQPHQIHARHQGHGLQLTIAGDLFNPAMRHAGATDHSPTQPLQFEVNLYAPGP